MNISLSKLKLPTYCVCVGQRSASYQLRGWIGSRSLSYTVQSLSSPGVFSPWRKTENMSFVLLRYKKQKNLPTVQLIVIKPEKLPDVFHLYKIQTITFPEKQRENLKKEEWRNLLHLLSMPMGVKSSLCLVWNRIIFALISTMDGDWTGIAMVNRASWGWMHVLLSLTTLWPWRNFSRPWNFNAWFRRKKFWFVKLAFDTS